MSSELNSVIVSKTAEGVWQAQHVPSGKTADGDSPEAAQDAMRSVLGINQQGKFEEPLTSPQFSGVTKDIALFLEGPISEMLAMHSGFARLESYEAPVATIRLGGGCEGCPSSRMTLLSGVLAQLQEKFGEDVVAEVIPGGF